MRFSMLGVCVHADDPAEVADFYRAHLGFTTALDLGWFVSLRHPGRDDLEVCVVHRDHAPSPHLAGPTRGVTLAFVLDAPGDVDAAHDRMRAAGVPVEIAPRDEPWGQHRAVVRDPAGTGVELVAASSPDPAWLAAHGL